MEIDYQLPLFRDIYGVLSFGSDLKIIVDDGNTYDYHMTIHTEDEVAPLFNHYVCGIKVKDNVLHISLSASNVMEDQIWTAN